MAKARYAWTTTKTRRGERVLIGRYKHPDWERPKEVSLRALGIRTRAQIEDWKRARSAEILRDLQRRSTGKTREVALEVAYRERPPYKQNARQTTRDAYRWAADRLFAWLAQQGVTFTHQITPRLLGGYAFSVEDNGLSIATKNTELRRARTLLRRWRRARLVSLTRDEIADELEGIPQPAPEPVPLKPGEIRAFVEAAVKAADPFGLVVLLGGFRVQEAGRLRWSDCDFDAQRIRLRQTATKTHRPRVVDLSVSPALTEILRRMPREGTFVWGPGVDPWTRHWPNTPKRRLLAAGAPDFTWQRLRQTCASYLTNAPGIFGGASIYRSAKQLGHRANVADRHYLDVVTGIDPEARTLEAAMGVADLLEGGVL